MGLRKSFLAIGLALCCSGSVTSAAEESMTFSLDNGHTLRGTVDERTDAKTLWVRREESGIRLTTAVPWARVASAERGEAVVSAMQLRAQREAYVTPASALVFGGETNPLQTAAAGQSGNPSIPARRSQVVSLEIVEVYPANLDRDDSIDGLIVRLAAFDEGGRPVAVRGSLRTQLWTQRRPWREPGGGKFSAEENWSQAFTKRDFVDGVATVKLPFRNLEPEAEFDLLPDAELIVQLTAYGSGNFEASAPVCLRPYDRFRDRLQQTNGTRYVPNELPGRMGRQRFDDTAGRWMGWP